MAQWLETDVLWVDMCWLIGRDVICWIIYAGSCKSFKEMLWLIGSIPNPRGSGPGLESSISRNGPEGRQDPFILIKCQKSEGIDSDY